MFTGIITDTSPVLQSRQAQNGLDLTLKAPKGWTDIKIGESIAVNGVCLTIASIQDGAYVFSLVPETLAKTTFGKQVPPEVNLERPLSATDRFGGHFVQGHVDTTGKIAGISRLSGYTLEIAYPKKFQAFVIPKGSVTVDGVALTVAACQDKAFSAALIPHTLSHTTLNALRPGDSVNLEFDMLGKYIVNFMEQRENAAS